MKIRFSLLFKMLMYILGASALIYFLAINVIINHFKNSAVTNSRFVADAYAQQYAKDFRSVFNQYFNSLYTHSYVIIQDNTIENQINADFNRGLLNNMLLNNKDFVATCLGWNPSVNGSDSVLLPVQQFVRPKSSIFQFDEDLKFPSGKDAWITRPVFKTYTSKKIDENFVSYVIVPLKKHNEIAGYIGAGINLECFQRMTDSLHPFGKGYVILLSAQGDIVTHPQHEKTGNSLQKLDLFSKNAVPVTEKIKSGQKFSFNLNNKNGNDSLYISLAPVEIVNDCSWSCAVVINIASVAGQTSSHLEKAWIIGYFGLLLLFIVVYIITLTITIPLKRTIQIIRKLSSGNFRDVEIVAMKSKDEIADMLHSLDTLIKSIQTTAAFASEFGKGNFDAHYHQLSEKDNLGRAIIKMRDSLKRSKEEADARKKLEEQLTWTSVGLAEFGKILRQNNDNLNKLTYDIIRFLIHYLDASEGGIYMVNEVDPEDIFIELKAYIGFGKEKYEQRTYAPGESLVGTCYLEKDTIFITEVPEHYIDIRSGLGKSKPLCILIVPLILNEVMVGILEIESIKVLEDYQVKFVEKVAVSIAATLSRVKFNVKTSSLLEQSKIQADELAQREEEIRQNMEELQATQEEANNRENEMRGVIEALRNTLLVIEYDIDGKILDVNDAMLKIYKVNKDQMIGKFFGFRIADEKKQEKLKEFWMELKQGRTKNNIQYFRTATREIWLDETYSPIFDTTGNPVKVLCLAFDITESRNKRQKIKSLIEKRDILSKRLTDTEGVETRKVAERLVAEEFNLQFIDLNYLVKVYKGDAQKIHNILNFYITIIPEEIEEMDKYYKDKNWEMLRTKASTLKTKMTYLGLKTMLNNSKNIEKYATEKTNLTEIPELMTEIQELWKEVEKELRQLIKNISELL